MRSQFRFYHLIAEHKLTSLYTNEHATIKFQDQEVIKFLRSTTQLNILYTAKESVITWFWILQWQP